MGSRLEKNSESVRKRIEAHTFEDETGEEYQGSKFGGFSDYFRRKKIKLQNLDSELRSESTGNPQIFKGVVAHVNGYTQPSLNDLHRMIVSHGGGFMQYLDGKTTVTHIIAANLTPKKAIEFKRYRIVKPAWIVDSVATGRLLPWESYRVLDEGTGQKLIGFHDGKIVNQSSTQRKGYRDQTNNSWYASQVRGVAESIDDEDGAHFPSPQNITGNSSAAYIEQTPADPYNSSKLAGSIEVDLELEAPVSSPDNFRLTSSMEDALAAANVTPEQAHVSDDFSLRSNAPADAIEASSTHVELPGTFETNTDVRLMNNARGNLIKASLNDLTKDDSTRSEPLPCSGSSFTENKKVLTAEEHNAFLLADPHVRKSSTANPEFLKQYYSESRLHHLSTWKADLKAKLQQMAAEKSPSPKQPTKRTIGSRRYIMHVDFDSFFCAMSLKSAPQYVDKPAVVAHGSGAGSEIASCNYPARAFGVKNGMWMKNALKLCPDLKVLPYDFPAYEEASKGFYEAILDVGGVVQSVSVDEALVDITSLVLPAGGSDGHGVREGSIWREQEKADEVSRILRETIREKTKCAVSVGIGSNILLAKVALRKAKPAGQHQIKPEEILNFIGELTVQDLPGVAYSIGGKLEEMGIKFVKDIRSISKERLIIVLGPKTGEKIWDYSRGIDRTEVGEQVVRKSVSAEVNWGIRFISQPEAEEFVQNLCDELHRRLLDQGVRGRQLTMKIMRRAADAPLDPPKHLGHGKCDTFNKSIVLGVATNSSDVIGREAISILRSYSFSPGELRGLGVQMTKLEPLKASGQGLPDSSQRRIMFNTPVAPNKAREGTEDPITDPDSPVKPRRTPVHPVMVVNKANTADSSTKKPLNLTGTQFLVPTQVDPSVLTELPPDIRSKLLAQGRGASVSRDHSPTIDSALQGPSNGAGVIPSQLDPEVFDALPEDVKVEVLASYSSHATPSHAQSLLPQSPRKVRSVHLSKKQIAPTKKRFGLHSRAKAQDPYPTLTQSNFIAHKTEGGVVSDSDGNQSDTLDVEFLAALPKDVRAEVLAEHRRARLARRSGLMTAANPAAKKRRVPGNENMVQKTLKLVPRPPKPTFTTQELSTLPELRTTLRRWYEEFRDDGPHPDDVGAIERYLWRVVHDEKDMAKAAGLVKWLAWVIDDDNDSPGKQQKGRDAWITALKGIKDKIQDAVAERGLGRMEF
ncbi:MAG: deoxycytidyl transferase [Claussenomyces sp. TS43310]|nr:MAG: deoxycytidyl transferase [Claussenomyces sp. TS43310]